MEHGQQWSRGLRSLRPLDDQVASTSTCKDDGKLHNDPLHSLGCSTSSASSLAATSGIRSLPNALLCSNSKEHIQQQHADSGTRHKVCVQLKGPSTSELQHANHSMPAAATIRPSTSTTRPGKYSTFHGMFSIFERSANDEFDRAHMLDKFAKLHSKVQQVCPRDFVVKGTHPSFTGTPSFSPFSYDSEPYRPDSATATCHGPNAATTQNPASTTASCTATTAASPAAHCTAQALFLPVGRSSSPELMLKAREDSMLRGLERQLADDWPGTFRDVHTEPGTGAVVVAFHTEAAGSSEAGVRSYMNELAKTGGAVAEFRLCKDAEHWGIVEEAAFLYRFWPPWVHHAAATSMAGWLSSSLCGLRQVTWPCRDYGRESATQACFTVPVPRTMRF